MNSSIRNVQILTDLLQQFGIKDIVLSPGGSDIPLIHSIETNPFFSCYSVVDERSAAYFAMGMAQQKNNPVACVCTSGTAVCNYVPGITEAFYQNVPVVAITADKNPYFQGQLETQKIEQLQMFQGVVKKSVSLPLINNADDEWLCNRLVNEALLEVTYKHDGPVQINMPIVDRTDLYDDKKLLPERKIGIVNRYASSEKLENLFEKLTKANRVMVVVGQNVVFSKETLEQMEAFFGKVNCIFATEHLSNLNCKGSMSTYGVSEMGGFNALAKLTPDIVISIGNNLSAYTLKPFLRANYKAITNWHINQGGCVRDAYKCLETIFDMSVDEFFDTANKYLKGANENIGTYYKEWYDQKSKIKIPEFDFSNMYVAEQLSKVIPENSILHLAILNSTRTMQFFDLKYNVRTYSNVGALGIDGCVSTFAGQAASTDELAYLVIGDLAFFYDMNAAGLRSISNNVRIILINNCGGSEFHFFIGKDKISSLNDYISAEHINVAAGWALSLGYDYYCASNKEELNSAIEKFGQKSDRPMFLEVLTDMEVDAKITKEFYSKNVEDNGTSIVKKMIKKVISDSTIEKVRGIIKSVR